MKKIDLTQVKFLDIEGRETMVDIAKVLGNIMFMQGQDIVEHELGSKVYHSADKLKGWDPQGNEPHPDCAIEVNEEEEKVLNKYIATQYSYVVQKAVKEALKSE